MRDVKLYYVYDNLNETVISSIIPQPNDLTAAIGFRDYYMSDEAKKKGINYKALDLVRFATVDISEDGEYFLNPENLQYDQVVRITGNEIMNFIKSKMLELGIDDNFVEEEKD